jgi:hypothetical protein
MTRGFVMLLQRLHNAIVLGLHVERRFEPFFRPAVDATLREPLAALIQFLINRQRQPDGLGIAEEREQPGEEAYLQAIIDTLGEYMKRHWRPGNYQRGGNTKTHGVVRATFTVRDDVPAQCRHGLFKDPKSYPAWVRFSGPGPDWPRDIDDVGFVSCAIKVMGVPGSKLLDDEKFTQDFLSICTPTFVTPDTRANARLQAWILKGTPLFYFADPRDSHLLDGLMQSLWNKTQSNPLGERYWSCVPYLLGEGQAMMYSVYPRSRVYRHIPRLPLRPPDNYLRDNMVRTSPNRMWSSTLWSSCRRIRSKCRLKTRLSAGRRNCRPSFRSHVCTFRANVSIHLSSSALQTCSRTILGIACPSIARSEIRAGHAGACIGSCPTCARP